MVLKFDPVFFVFYPHVLPAVHTLGVIDGRYLLV
jgi:hypothetical protein